MVIPSRSDQIRDHDSFGTVDLPFTDLVAANSHDAT